MNFLIGADIVPTRSNVDRFVQAQSRDLVGDALLDILNGASCRIFNLEVPLVERETPILKYGPNLQAPTAAVEGFKALGIDCLALANNHILDQGAQGLQSTVSALDSAGISHLGAGNSIAGARRPFVFPFGGRRVGVYACAEHEFSTATEKTPGANPFDPLWSPDHVAALKNEVDYVVVLYHGGKEHYRYPSPDLQRICRRFVDKGADLVVCQHSHCIGCEEKYGAGTIVYGQGNFIFDYSDSEFWQTGLLISVGRDFAIEYLPIVKAGNGVRLAEQGAAQEIMDGFYARSNQIKAEGFLEKAYSEFAQGYLADYESAFRGRRTIVERGLNKLSGGKYSRWKSGRRFDRLSLVRIVNYVNCEAHRELLLSALRNEISKGR